MRMRQSKRRPQYDYCVVGNKFENSVCERDLGVNIDPNLSPASHIGEQERRQSVCWQVLEWFHSVQIRKYSASYSYPTQGQNQKLVFKFGAHTLKSTDSREDPEYGN